MEREREERGGRREEKGRGRGEEGRGGEEKGGRDLIQNREKPGVLNVWFTSTSLFPPPLNLFPLIEISSVSFLLFSKLVKSHVPFYFH